jgi:hypothetical protein
MKPTVGTPYSHTNLRRLVLTPSYAGCLNLT